MGRDSRWPLAESALRIDIRELGRPSPGAPRGIFSPKIREAGVTLGYSCGFKINLKLHFGETYSYMRLHYNTDDLGSRAGYVQSPGAVDETIA